MAVPSIATFCAATISIVLLLLIICRLLLLMMRRSSLHIGSLKGKHAVITGGSSGIGYSLAAACLAAGASVTLMARNASRLSDAAKQLSSTVLISSEPAPHNRILLKAVDVSDATAVMSAIQESFNWKPIDILICNAGITMPGFLDEVGADVLDLVINTNLMGCAYTVHAALPLMKARSHQHPCSIVLMSSVSALFFLSGVNMYTSSKYGLKGLAETLRFELLPYNIKVSLVCPGFTETPMLDKQDSQASTSVQILLSKVYKYDRAKAESVDHVVAKTIKGVMQGEFLITTSLMGFFLSILSRGFVPAESLSRTFLEALLLVPVRLSSYVWIAHIRRVIKRIHEDELGLIDID